MKLYFSIFGLILLLTTQIQAQSTYQGLNKLLNMEFFDEYDSLKMSIEDKVLQVKLEEYKYHQEDIEKLMDSYNAAAEYFNRTMFEKMKNDLLKRRERRKMISFPDVYAQDMGVRLKKAKEFYERTFGKEYYDITKNTAAIPMTLIYDIIKYSQVAIELIKAIKKEVKKYNDKLLNDYLIEPHKFKAWDEIN